MFKEKKQKLKSKNKRSNNVEKTRNLVQDIIMSYIYPKLIL